MYNLFPLILCLIPVHSFYAQNIGEISFKTYIDAVLKFSLFIIVFMWLFVYFVNDIAVSGILFSLSFYAICYAGCFFMLWFSKYQRSLIKNKVLFLICYSIILMSSLYLVYFFLRLYPIFISLILKLAFWCSVIITFFIGLDIFTNKINNKIIVQDNNINDDLLKDYVAVKTEKLPNIYHIMLDGHTGFSIPKYTDFYFKEELEKRGFILRNIRSNYSYTALSMSSMFNMDYAENIIPKQFGNVTIQKMWPFYFKNIVFDFLKQKKYCLNLIYSRVFLKIRENCITSDCDYVNTDTKPCNTIIYIILYNSLFNIIFDSINKFSKNDITSVFKHFNKKYFSNNDAVPIFRAFNNYFSLKIDVKDLFTNFVKQSRQKKKQPMYCYMHLCAPHHPYLSDENGNEFDVDEINNHKNYMSYQKYINKEVLSVIDEIKNNDNNSIIIVHSDHNVPFDNDLKNRFNILFGIYSGNNKILLPKYFTLVNFYRYLFKYLFKIDLPILENKYYDLKNFRTDNEYLEKIYNIEE